MSEITLACLREALRFPGRADANNEGGTIPAKKRKRKFGDSRRIAGALSAYSLRDRDP